MIQCVTSSEDAVLDLVYSMAGTSDVLLRDNPRDAAALSSKNSIVQKFVARDDQYNMETEILHSLAGCRADLLTKLMPVSQDLLNRLPEFGINRVVIGKKIDDGLMVPPGMVLLDGALEDELEVLNRPWLKRCKTGLPLITGLQLLGLDGVPLRGRQSIDWGLEKFDLQSMFVQSGCIANPENIPDFNGVVDCEAQQLNELLIFGRPVKLLRISDRDLSEDQDHLSKNLMDNAGCHITWCLASGTLESLFRIGFIDELVTQIVPAISGRLIDRDCLSLASADSIGKSARVKSIIRNTGTCNS